MMRQFIISREKNILLEFHFGRPYKYPACFKHPIIDNEFKNLRSK